MRRPRAALATAVTALALTLPAAAPAQASPRLQVSRTTVVKAMTCWGNPRAGRRPVLFLHGTTSNSRANWSWNWNRAFRQRHRAYCDLDLPASGNDDIQVAAQYVTRAIRILHHRAGRKISLVGHSQGGMIGRWSLKYWPDTRRMVDDYVGLSSSNHGTQVAQACVAARSCSAATWQQRAGSHFLRALNAGPDTFGGISYTEISTNQDEVVQPTTSPYLAGPARRVTNVSIQLLCPAETADHFAMAYDNAAWLIGYDALTHRGPARLGRISRTTCGKPFMPGVDPATFAQNASMAMAQTAQSSATARQYPAEPPLQPYAR